jgi:signal transduction histidine kinase
MHQLNNKVGAIPVRVQGIEDKCVELLGASAYLATNLRDIEQSARQAMAIVRDSMAHLRPVKPRPVAVAPCLERALQRAAPGPAIKIRQTGLEQLPRVMAGEQQLEMVFYNLIDNALTALAGQGELHFQGVWQDQEVALTVADSGPGIAPEIQSHLFDFSPAAEGQTSWQLGFGLWWVKTFMDRFGGRLQVDSQPGQGSAFTVWLPAERG